MAKERFFRANEVECEASVRNVQHLRTAQWPLFREGPGSLRRRAGIHFGMSKESSAVRYAEMERETAETRVRVVLDLDGGSRRDISTGIGFFDHMLDLLAFHGQIDLGVQADGDRQVDDHHTVEDVGIVLGQAIRHAAYTGVPVERYADVNSVMDEALVLVAMDISGRGQLHYDVNFRWPKLGEMGTDSVREFFRALSQHAGITLHIRAIAGENDHHIAEATFKGFGRALYDATRPTNRRGNSSKGNID